MSIIFTLSFHAKYIFFISIFVHSLRCINSFGLLFFHLLSLWLRVLVVLSWSSWSHELIGLLLGKSLLNSWELVRGESCMLVYLHLSLSLNVLLVIMMESGGSITLLAPVIKVKLIVSCLGLSSRWRFMGSVGSCLSVDLSFGLGVNLGLARCLVSLLVSILIFGSLRGLSIGNDSSVLLQVVVSGSVSTLLTPVI